METDEDQGEDQERAPKGVGIHARSVRTTAALLYNQPMSGSSRQPCAGSCAALSTVLLVLALGACESTSSSAGNDTPAPAIDLAAAFGEHLHGFTFGTPQLKQAGDRLQHARYADGERVLRIQPGGSFESAAIHWRMPFDELLLSWNVDTPAGTSFVVEVAVRDAEGWSPWLHIGDWGELPTDRERVTTFAGGAVEVDVLRTKRLFSVLRYRISAVGTRGGAPIDVHLFAINVTNTGQLASLHAGAPSPFARGEGLAVPARSQRLEDPALASRICSPTSVAMVLAHHGVDLPTARVAELIYDQQHDIYGNWPRAVQAAFELGVPGTLVRLSNWRAVEHFLARGIPLIVSVGVKDGELRGAPYSETRGHLLVITGFDDEGGVRVNDPAADTLEGVSRVYAREDLERVWMRRGGVAYAIGR